VIHTLATISSMDPFNRNIDYLRLSITDRCNERCLYCMPEGYHGWAQKPDHLTASELTRVVEAAVNIGFRKFRLTGGEPLLRRDVVEITRSMAAIAGVECLGLSTNGTALAALAAPLRAAGLRTINISLDTLNPDLYRKVTGSHLAPVLAGIRAAKAAEFECLKLNCVLMRGINEADLWPLVLFAAEYGLPLRLIELMPLSRTDVLKESHFMPISEAMDRLREKDELVPCPDRRLGWGPAKYYHLKRVGAMIGFIGALTDQHFCETCNKMRLTADGKIRPCLGQHEEIDLRGALRTPSDHATVQRLLLEAIHKKPKEHQFCGQYHPQRPMTSIGG